MGKIAYQEVAKSIVSDYMEEHLDESDGPVEFEVYVVWFCKTLQNAKVLLSSTLLDGMYYEVTFDGNQDMAYLDAYKKFENRSINLI